MLIWKWLMVPVAMLLGTGMAACQQADALEMSQLEVKDCEKIIDLSLRMLRIRETAGVCEQLADCQFDLENYAAAERWYARSLELNGDNHACRWKYAEALRIQFKVQDAIQQMQIYGSRVNDPKTVEDFMERCERALLFQTHQGKYLAWPLKETNTQETEIVAYQHGSELYFYSRATPSNIGKYRRLSPEKAPFNLYAYDFGKPEDKHKVRMVSEKCSPNEIGLGMVWDAFNNQYFVTRFESTGPREGFASIYRSRTDGYGNVREIEMPFCKMGHNNNFQPAIDPTGQILVFVSDSDSGWGERDLFYCTFHKSSGWSEPKNLGPDINTEEDETYPCFSSEGRLYFSSDGAQGFGETDIYSVAFTVGTITPDTNNKKKIVTTVQWDLPMNVGAKINSPYDDFAIVWNPATQNNTGYFSSNRPDSALIASNPGAIDSIHGRCNIYRFEFKPEVVGRVFCANNRQPIPFPSVTLWKEGIPPQALSAGSDGIFYGNPVGTGITELVVQKRGYMGKVAEINLSAITPGEDIQHDFYLPFDTIQWWSFQHADTALKNKEVQIELIDSSVVGLRKGISGRADEIEVEFLRGHDYILEITCENRTIYYASPGKTRLAADSTIVLEFPKMADASLVETSAKLPAPIPVVVTSPVVVESPAPVDTIDPPQKLATPPLPPTASMPPLCTFFYEYGKIALYNVSAKALTGLRSQLQGDTTMVLELSVFTATGGDHQTRMEICQKRAAKAAKDFAQWLAVPPSRIRTQLYAPTVKTNDCADCHNTAQFKQGRLEVRLRSNQL